MDFDSGFFANFVKPPVLEAWVVFFHGRLSD